MIQSFKTLKIGSENLEPGKCELGILVPREFVKNDLDSLSVEFENLSDIFKVFDEVATGNRHGFTVRSISSSDFGLYIAAAAPVSLLISQSIDKLMSAYRNYWEVKKIKQSLHENNKIPIDKLWEMKRLNLRIYLARSMNISWVNLHLLKEKKAVSSIHQRALFSFLLK